MVFVRLFLFGISTLGSCQLLREISGRKVNLYFLPSLTIAIQVTLLFFGGLWNLLPEVTMLLYIAGFLGVIYSLYKEKSLSFLKDYVNTGYAVLVILSVISAASLRGKIFSSYDNFSHWATVVQSMLETNRFPNFEDTRIMFQEYPLGSSSYIYYFAKLISTSESVQMLAQCYMMLAALLPLFAFAKKHSIAAAVVIVSFINYALLYNIVIIDLMVDTLLPLVGICGLLFTYLHCKTGDTVSFYFSACYMIQVIQIKNSGIFFSILIAFLLLHSLKQNKQYLNGTVATALPFLSLLLWQKHCKYVFASASTSKHAMTVENYKSVFGNKTPEVIRLICSSLLKFAISYKEVWIAAGFGVMLGILILCIRKELWRPYRKIAVCSIALYVIYQFGMLAMYLFSMPEGEAVILASVERYTKTILLAILYINMVPAVRLISESAGTKITSLAAAGIIFASSFVGMYLSTGSVKVAVQQKTEEPERTWIEAVCASYNIPKHDSYCILIPSEDAGYAYFLGKYLFQSNDISTVVAESDEALDGITSRYLFVYDRDNEIVKNWIAVNYPDQYGNDVIVQETE